MTCCCGPGRSRSWRSTTPVTDGPPPSSALRRLSPGQPVPDEGWPVSRARGAEPYLRPDRLRVRVADGASPAVGVGLDEEQSAARGVVGGPPRHGRWQVFGAGVGHLDVEAVRQEVQRQPEVAAGEAAVADRVRRQLGGDEGDGSGGVGVVRQARPLGELLHGEPAGEAGAASGAAEAQGELAGGGERRLRLFGEVMVGHGVSVAGWVAR